MCVVGFVHVHCPPQQITISLKSKNWIRKGKTFLPLSFAHSPTSTFCTFFPHFPRICYWILCALFYFHPIFVLFLSIFLQLAMTIPTLLFYPTMARSSLLLFYFKQHWVGSAWQSILFNIICVVSIGSRAAAHCPHQFTEAWLT